MSQGFSYRQRLVLRDLLRHGPRTTNQLSSWWDCEGREPAHRTEDERRAPEKARTDFNGAVYFAARQALYSLEREGLISNEARKISRSGGRRELGWILTPRGEEIAKRIDDELGQTPTELLKSANLDLGDS